MILLSVDEAYAFDYLAILYVKSDISPQMHINKIMCEEFLKSQFDIDLWTNIINSVEFQNMISINREVFETVELARYGSISAKTVDEKNMERFYAKQRFQNKFFPNDGLSEWKT